VNDRRLLLNCLWGAAAGRFRGPWGRAAGYPCTAALVPRSGDYERV